RSDPRRRTLVGKPFPRSGPGQGRRFAPPLRGRPAGAILDADLRLGITLRQAIDGAVSLLMMRAGRWGAIDRRAAWMLNQARGKAWEPRCSGCVWVVAWR